MFLKTSKSNVAVLFLWGLLILQKNCFAQIEYGTIFTNSKINIHTSLMNSTFRIIGFDSLDNEIVGTCFVLKTADTLKSNRLIFITAKHVLQDIAGEYASVYYPCYSDSSLGNCRKAIQIRNGYKTLWFELQDSSIDIAAVLLDSMFFGNREYLSTDFLATEETLLKYQLKTGDHLFCIGFPMGASSNEFGHPILKGGYLASYPVLPTNIHKSFLYDCDVYPANSGSPVYARESGRYFTEANGFVFDANSIQLICGIIVSRNLASQMNDIESGNTESELVSLNLATVVPSTYILELVESCDDHE